ncbi:LacI family DNA-binding transcriptional regulator, partial [Streptomyces sp. NPDC013178]|uniref:LacI family DNA-binding transcriptional regulator n=1 Tax=Streptomyces sp. NPDC013178 TaxID=3155118 RepID=UPI003403FA85
MRTSSGGRGNAVRGVDKREACSYLHFTRTGSTSRPSLPLSVAPSQPHAFPICGVSNRFEQGVPVNIGEIAQRAGVSRSTVSYALSGKRPVSEDTRQKIQRV